MVNRTSRNDTRVIHQRHSSHTVWVFMGLMFLLLTCAGPGVTAAQELVVEDVYEGQIGKDIPTKIGASTSSAIPLNGTDLEMWFQSNQDYLRSADIRIENGQLTLLTPESPLWSDGAGLPADDEGKFCNGDVLSPANNHAHWAGPSILEAMGEKVLISAYGNSDVIRGSITLSYTQNGTWKHQHQEAGPDFLLYPFCLEDPESPNTWVNPADPATYDRGIGEICKHNGVAFTGAVEDGGYYYVYFNVTTNHNGLTARTIQLMRVEIDSNPPYVKFGAGHAEIFHKGQQQWHPLPFDPEFGYFLNICGQAVCTASAGGSGSVWCQSPWTFSTVPSWSVTGLNDLGRLGGVSVAQDGSFLLSHVDFQNCDPDLDLDVDFDLMECRRQNGRIAYWRSFDPTFSDTSIQYINTDRWLQDPTPPTLGCPNDNSSDTWFVNMAQAQSWLYDLPGNDPDMVLFTGYHDARCQPWTRGKIRASAVGPAGGKLCLSDTTGEFFEGEVLDFGDAPPETNVSKSLWVENCGNASVTITGTPISGTHSGNFWVPRRFLGRGTLTLQPGTGKSMRVLFRGIAEGPRNARLTLESDAPSNPDFEIPLQGEIVVTSSPELCVTVDGQDVQSGFNWDFGSTASHTPVSETATLRNCGTESLTLSSATVGGTHQFNFYMPSSFTNQLPLTLTPGAQVAMQVTMGGAAEGPRTAQLTLGSNDTSTPNFVLDLSGEIANTPELCVSVDGQDVQSGFDWSFGTTSSNVSVTETATLRNCGSGDLTLSSATVSGTHQFNFYLASSFTNQLPLTLAPGAQVSMPMTMSGTAEGPRSALLTLGSNAATSSFVMDLSGQIASVPELCVTVNGQGVSSGYDWNFGSTPSNVGVTRTATLSNCGTGSLTISAADISGTHRFNFYLASSFTNQLPITLNAGGQVSMSMTMSGSAEGPRNALLTLSSNGASDPSFQMDLLGQISNPAALCVLINGQQVTSGSTWDFGSTPSGTATAQTAVLQNCGSGTLTISGTSITGTHRFNFYHPASFTVPINLAPGAQASMPITMTGSAVGSRSALVTVSSDAGSFSLNLTGQITN